MSYEPNEWKAGDIVTSAKLNKMEQGIANGTLVVNLTWSSDNTVATMDKTWQQIYDADSVVILDRYENDTDLIVGHLFLKKVEHTGSLWTITTSSPDSLASDTMFEAETANSYPVFTNAK